MRLKRRKLPGGGFSWRAHFIDPDIGREVAITLEGDAARTKESRETWAKHKAADLARIRMQRAAGIRPIEVTKLDDAIEEYLETAKARLRRKTIATHAIAIGRLKEWARKERVEITAELTRAKLALLREHLIRIPKQTASKGGKRGSSKASRERRSPMSVNRELASIKALCNVWRVRGLLPNVHRDDLADALASLPAPREQPEFLSAAALKKLLAAAMRHDADTFEETREEHVGARAKGTTLRYTPIAAFLATLLLTGMRRGEALALKWPMVELDALDSDGRKVGEIRLPAAITKTHHGRTIGLEVSPALRKILAALRLQSSKGYVFGGREPYTGDLVDGARHRMFAEEDGFGAPVFSWQLLRSTCATYLTNAGGIFGAASAFLSAKQLGHSVQIAERHYAGVMRGIPRSARTLEAAMQIEAELAEVLGVIVVTGARTVAS